MVNYGQGITPEELFFKCFDGGGFAERIRCLYQIGKEVQYEWAKRYIGNVFVLAVVRYTPTRADVHRWLHPSALARSMVAAIVEPQ